MKEIVVEVTAGKEDGHMPGRLYCDVTATITRTTAGRWVVELVQSWGSCQGYDIEDGNRRVMARGRTLQQAVEEAIRRAKAATLSENYVIQALSCAEAEAAEEEEALAEQDRVRSTDLSKVPLEQLLVEVKARGATA